MKIAIISICSFPNGMASTNRVNAICRGLIEAGDIPTVIMPFPTESYESKTTLPECGYWKGIRYVHISGRRRAKSRILRALALKTGYRYHIGVARTKKWLKENPQDIVIIYNDECRDLRDFGKAIKDIGAKAIFIFDEYPTPIREYGAQSLPDGKRHKFTQILPMFDGYVSINKVLADFYNQMVHKPTLEMSMIVDTARFTPTEGPRREWITYMGQILPDKDNIINIIEAFDLIKDEFPDVSFHIFGKGNEKSLEGIKCKIRNLGLEKRVILEGFLPDNKVTQTMMTSKILVSSQPDNKRVEGVLSTKLAEYVASGTPTVMCKVGANNDYLSDNDCFFAIPDNPEDYADKLRYILKNYDKALECASHGKQTVRDKYSMNTQGRRLSDFLKSLE